MQYVIIDIETTGLHCPKDTIIEIGAILVDKDFEIIKVFETYVYASYVPPFITQFNGIKYSDLVNAPKIKKALQELVEFAQDAIPMAHNAPFDKRFIRFYLEECGIPYVQNTWIDTVKLFKEKFPGMKDYKLDTLIKHFNLAVKEDHRALSDAKHTLSLLKL